MKTRQAGRPSPARLACCAWVRCSRRVGDPGALTLLLCHHLPLTAAPPPIASPPIDSPVASLQPPPPLASFPPPPGLDVFEDEPAMKPGLAQCSNAVIVPHIASATLWTRAGMVRRVQGG